MLGKNSLLLEWCGTLNRLLREFLDVPSLEMFKDRLEALV